MSNPQPFLDLFYADSCLEDLLCTPVLYHRFIEYADKLIELKPLNGFTIFRYFLEDALKRLRMNGVRHRLYEELREYLKEMALSQLLRGLRSHRILSYELWEVLCGYTEYSMIRLESDNCMAYLHSNLAQFYTAIILMEEAFNPECKLKDCVQLFKSQMLRKILKELVTAEDKQRLMQRVLDSKYTVYFGLPPEGSGIAISILNVCGVDLSGMDLTLAEIPYSSLHCCNMEGSCLKAANLTASDLTRAYCRGCELGTARLSNRLKIAELESVKMKNSVQDVLVLREHDLLLTTGGQIAQMNWENIHFQTSFNQASEPVRLMAGSPGYLVTLSESNAVGVWDINKGNKIREFEATITYVEFMCLIQSYVVVGRRSVELEMWDYYKATKVKRILNKGLISHITTLGSGVLVIGDERGVVSLLTIPSTYIEVNFQAHDHEVVGIATGEDHILTASEDRIVKIWRKRHKVITL